MRTVFIVIIAVSAVSIQGAQRRITNGLIDRVSTSAKVEPPEVAPTKSTTISLEVTPDDGIRVYAPGAKDYTPVAILLVPQKQLKVEKAAYGIPEVDKEPGRKKRAPLYSRPFNISYRVTVDKDVKPGTMIRVTGTLIYQTCDERVVYPQRAIPVSWMIRVGDSKDTTGGGSHD